MNQSERREMNMKKLVGILLVVSLALSLACATAFADEVPQPEGGKKFESDWAIFGMTAEIYYEEEGYRVYIRSTDPYEKNGTEWEYSCFYNEEKDALLSVSSSKNSWTENPETGDIQRGDYEYQGLDDEGQTTVFAVNADGCLTWEDGRGSDGADLVFTDIGRFRGYWNSEDGETWAEILWSDSEIGDDYGYHVYFHESTENGFSDYSLHGLYDPETRKLTVSGPVAVSTLNAEGEYDTEEAKEPAELVFSALEDGKILLERDNLELSYDLLGGDSQG